MSNLQTYFFDSVVTGVEPRLARNNNPFWVLHLASGDQVSSFDKRLVDAYPPGVPGKVFFTLSPDGRFKHLAPRPDAPQVDVPTPQVQVQPAADTIASAPALAPLNLVPVPAQASAQPAPRPSGRPGWQPDPNRETAAERALKNQQIRNMNALSASLTYWGLRKEVDPAPDVTSVIDIAKLFVDFIEMHGRT